MGYNEKIRRIEEIIREINSGEVDPAEIMKKIEEAKGLIKECGEELGKLTIEK